MSVPAPTADIVVVASPVPSIVKIAARSNGETRNALAAWQRWCSR
jgi:hypothetical protein